MQRDGGRCKPVSFASRLKRRKRRRRRHFAAIAATPKGKNDLTAGFRRWHRNCLFAPGMRVPRKSTLLDSGIFHKMWRGHNREHVLESADEKSRYLECLQESLTQEIKKHVQLHAIAIMGNHPHELGRIAKDPSGKLDKGIQSLSRWMRKAHGRFVTRAPQISTKTSLSTNQ